MIITYHGKQFFKIQKNETIVALNPLGKENRENIKTSKFKSDVVLCTTRHSDYAGIENTQYKDYNPFIIQGPGSYEVDNNLYVGFLSSACIDNKEYNNTIYFFQLDTISFCFLGALSSPTIDQKIKEYTESVDVLFVPIGGGEVLDPMEASKIIKYFSPRVIIPMDYGGKENDSSLETFSKECSFHGEAQEKYVFKKKDLEALNGQIVVLRQI